MILVLEKEGGIKLGPGRGVGSPEGETADCAAVLAQPPSLFRPNWAHRAGPLVSGNSEAHGSAGQGGGPMSQCGALLLSSLPVPCRTTFVPLLGHGATMLSTRPQRSWEEPSGPCSGALGLA